MKSEYDFLRREWWLQHGTAIANTFALLVNLGAITLALMTGRWDRAGLQSLVIVVVVAVWCVTAQYRQRLTAEMANFDAQREMTHLMTKRIKEAEVLEFGANVNGQRPRSH